jgi:ribosome-binding ATPase YchF (GTP1/OBG family)
MPIRLNLLSEVQAEEELRRRDPVKRATFIGVFLVALSLVWFSSVWLETKIALKTKTQVDSEIQSQTNEYNRVVADLKKISDGQRQITALQQLNTNRFLQGNLLNALQKIYLPNVQITRLRLEQNYSQKEGTTPSGNIPARAGAATEKITLTLDARDFSSSPGDQVNRYKELLSKNDYFLKNIQPNGVRLLNLSAPQTAMNGRSYVMFSLECRFTEKTR